MKLTARDQDQQNALAHAYHDRERFTLTGAGLQAEFVAEVLNRVPCAFGSGRYETNLELVQVTEATTLVEWTGEGLPPVGTVCDLKFDHWTDWERHEILCHGNKFIFVRELNSGLDREGSMSMDGIMFRTVRTAEQIAAEERDAALTDIALLMGKDPDRPRIREMAAILYDAGYRKV